MRIKVFRFRLSNWTSSPLKDDRLNPRFKEQSLLVDTPERIESIVNGFCSEHDVVDIKTTHIDVEYHNNARGNTIDVLYSIVYLENRG